jgi:hypothetical protein
MNEALRSGFVTRNGAIIGATELEAVRELRNALAVVRVTLSLDQLLTVARALRASKPPPAPMAPVMDEDDD